MTNIGKIIDAVLPLPGVKVCPNDCSQFDPPNMSRQSHSRSPCSFSLQIPPFSQGQILGSGLGLSAA